MPYIHFSEDESLKNQLRIGRTDIIQSIDSDSLMDELFMHNIDVCRLKISLSDTAVYDKIRAIGFPVATYSILVRQSIQLEEAHKQFIPQLTIVPYKYEQRDLLKEMVRNILNNDTASYYENDIYHHLFDQNIVIESSATYFSIFDHTIDPDKYTFLAYKGDDLVGFCTLQINGDEGEGIYMGLLPEFRSANFAREFVYTEQMQSALRNCRSYHVSTVILNPRSLNTTLKSGMKITDILLNLNVYSLLNRGIETSFTLKTSLQSLQAKLCEIVANKFPEMFIQDFVIRNKAHTFEVLNWHIHYPIVTEKIVILIIFDTDKKCFGHLRCGL